MASDPAGKLLPKLGDRGPVRCMAPDLAGVGSSGVQDVDLTSGEVRGFCLASQSCLVPGIPSVGLGSGGVGGFSQTFGLGYDDRERRVVVRGRHTGC